MNSRVLCQWALVVGMAAAAHPMNAGLESDRWIEVSSENFRLYSQLSRKKSVELVETLEMFRLATAVVTNVRMRPEVIPTQIFVFENTEPWAHLDEDRVGLFLPSLRRNHILVRQTSQMDEVSVLLHEYVHYLTRNNTGIRYPSWFEEGLAEYLSSIRLKGEKFQVGLFLESRLLNFQYSSWIPFAQLLSADRYDRWTKERRSMFYAQSWALVHYLFSHSEIKDSFAERMSVYLNRLEAGKGHVAAFEEAFGLQADAMNSQIRRYIERGRFPIVTFKTDDLLPRRKPSIARPSIAAVAASLGELALRTGALDRAEEWFVLAGNDEAYAARALSGLGSVALYGEPSDDEAANSLFERAMAADPADPLIRLDAANLFLRSLESETEVVDAADTEVVRGLIASAQALLVSAWRLDQNSAETYTKLGATLVVEAKDPARAVEMLSAARDLLPSNLYIRAQLALAYEQAANVEAALGEARSVVAWSHQDSSSAKAARGVIDRLQLVEGSVVP